MFLPSFISTVFTLEPEISTSLILNIFNSHIIFVCIVFVNFIASIFSGQFYCHDSVLSPAVVTFLKRAYSDFVILFYLLLQMRVLAEFQGSFP